MRYLLLSIVILFSVQVYAQQVDSLTPPPQLAGEEALTVAEKMPVFPGGEEAMMQFISKNINYPKQAQDAGVQGKVYISFTVDKEGNIKDVEILKDIGQGCGEEAVRVVKMMPQWTPGEQGGKKVDVNFRLPVSFVLQ